MTSAQEWARDAYDKKPPGKLTDRQERAANLFGKVKAKPKPKRRKAA